MQSTFEILTDQDVGALISMVTSSTGPQASCAGHVEATKFLVEKGDIQPFDKIPTYFDILKRTWEEPSSYLEHAAAVCPVAQFQAALTQWNFELDPDNKTIQLFADKGFDVTSTYMHHGELSPLLHLVVKTLRDENGRVIDVDGEHAQLRQSYQPNGHPWLDHILPCASVQFLMERGADINELDSYGRTALFLTTKLRTLVLTKELLRLGANPLLKNPGRVSPLELAISQGQIKYVKAFLEAIRARSFACDDFVGLIPDVLPVETLPNRSFGGRFSASSSGRLSQTRMLARDGHMEPTKTFPLPCRDIDRRDSASSEHTITDEDTTDEEIADEEITDEEITDEETTDEEITDEETTDEELLREVLQTSEDNFISIWSATEDDDCIGDLRWVRFFIAKAMTQHHWRMMAYGLDEEELFSMRSIIPFFFVPACLAVPYAEYIYAPSSRILIPPAVVGVNGSVTTPAALTNASDMRPAVFNGPSSVTFDFQKNVAGIVSIDIASASSDAFIGVTFSESSLYISEQACDATADAGFDSPLWFSIAGGPSTYTAAEKHNRGGFRYMTLVSNTTAAVSVNRVTVNFTAAPTQNLRAYTGYFHSNDELLNRIWYAGAYTNQLSTIDPAMGNALPCSVLTDGAKRDRLIWPGDMSISLEAIGVSTYDLYSVRVALELLFGLQKEDGRLPYASPPFADTISFTYHCHSLNGLALYYLYSGDLDWLSRHWNQFKRGVDYALSSVDATGLANITASSDWLRFGMGGHNIEANSLLHYVLNQGLNLAAVLNDTSVQHVWASKARNIKAAANLHLWDNSTGLFRDNETTTLYPQDGNVWAVKSNLTQSISQIRQISQSLRNRWGKIRGFELQAHYIAGNPNSALDLLRLEWGFMMDDPRMTNSTFIEGYSSDGSLHYEPYTNDPRVSHAHGWSTGPTSVLMNYAAGLRLESAAGATWSIAPQPGNLTSVDAGFVTKLGTFAIDFEVRDGTYQHLRFSTPIGTTGDVVFSGENGTLISANGVRVALGVGGVASGLPGGNWTFVPRS
ncbi:Bacterial alpha-L-rhamnosidase [Penicillium expansum]|nr:Bacterial alpha-L-rhamnosidase [Penicillium expansum]